MYCLESFLVFFYILYFSYITLYQFTLFCICIVSYYMFVTHQFVFVPYMHIFVHFVIAPCMLISIIL